MNLCVCLYPFPKNLPMKRVLVVDNYDSFVYNLVQILREEPTCSFEVVTNDHIPFDRLNEFDRLLLSPGPGVPEEAGDLLSLIDRCYQSHAILGVCLGHQAIGQYFGARLTQMPTPKHGHPTSLKILDHQDILYKQLSEPILVGRYHSWLLSPSSFPSCLRITATDEEGHIMSFTHKRFPIYGVQFHPESILTPQGRYMVRNFLRLQREP